MSPSTVLLRLRRLVGPPRDAEDTDGQLLERFLTRGDEVAFEMLLERHGPMVHGVCRRLLHDGHQIEDAFQATFLVLVRKGDTIARRESVGNWLHGVARRVALRVRGRSARQQACEKARAEMIATKTMAEPARDDVSSVLDEEVQRLPSKYRTALVLCYLEGKTNEEAAGSSAVRPAPSSPACADREMLRGRLGRRGVVMTSTALTAARARHRHSLGLRTGRVACRHASGGDAGSPRQGGRLARRRCRRRGNRARDHFGPLESPGRDPALARRARRHHGRPGDHGCRTESNGYPRRLLAIHVQHHLFAEGVEAGPEGRDFRAVAGSLGRRLHIAERNVTVLDESGRNPLPLTRPVLEKTIGITSPAAGPQDRVVLLFAGDAATIRGKAYLVPFEGEMHSPDTLIAFDWLYKELERCKRGRRW